MTRCPPAPAILGFLAMVPPIAAVHGGAAAQTRQDNAVVVLLPLIHATVTAAVGIDANNPPPGGIGGPRS